VFFDAVRETAKVESFRKLPALAPVSLHAERPASSFHGSSMAMGKAIAYPTGKLPANRRRGATLDLAVARSYALRPAEGTTSGICVAITCDHGSGRHKTGVCGRHGRGIHMLQSTGLSGVLIRRTWGGAVWG